MFSPLRTLKYFICRADVTISLKRGSGRGGKLGVGASHCQKLNLLLKQFPAGVFIAGGSLIFEFLKSLGNILDPAAYLSSSSQDLWFIKVIAVSRRVNPLPVERILVRILARDSAVLIKPQEIYVGLYG
jgi:hypothetical protein